MSRDSLVIIESLPMHLLEVELLLSLRLLMLLMVAKAVHNLISILGHSSRLNKALVDHHLLLRLQVLLGPICLPLVSATAFFLSLHLLLLWRLKLFIVFRSRFFAIDIIGGVTGGLPGLFSRMEHLGRRWPVIDFRRELSRLWRLFEFGGWSTIGTK